MNDREHARQWAQQLLSRLDWCILDTETTGLHADAEVCQIAIIAPSGQVLLDSLVKPTRPIPWDATAIHHITDAMVADAPTFADLAPQLRDILSGLTVVVYNAAFDARMLEQSAAPHCLAYEVPIFGPFTYECAMEMYSQWVGDWSSYHGNYRWQRLPGGDHTALGDARACLAVIKRIAGIQEG